MCRDELTAPQIIIIIIPILLYCAESSCAVCGELLLKIDNFWFVELVAVCPSRLFKSIHIGVYLVMLNFSASKI